MRAREPIASTDNGKMTQYLVDTTSIGNVVGEYDGSGNLIANYTQGLGLVSRVTATNTAYYYNYRRQRQSTVGLVGKTGTYVNSYHYLPFGEIQNATGTLANPFQYNGQLGVMAQGDGLVLMRARFYSPSLGKFINSDPIGQLGGTNVYMYALNNPVNLLDPTGLNPAGPYREPPPPEPPETPRFPRPGPKLPIEGPACNIPSTRAKVRFQMGFCPVVI